MAAYTEQLYEQVLDGAEHKSIEAASEVVSLSKDKKLSRIKIQHWNENVKSKTIPHIGGLRARYVQQEDTTERSSLKTEFPTRSPCPMAVKRPVSPFEVFAAESNPALNNNAILFSSDDSRPFFPNKPTHLGESASPKPSTFEEGFSCNRHPSPATSEGQIEYYKAIHEQTRRLQQQVEDRSFAEETPAENEPISSVLRERNIFDPGDDVSIRPNVWGVQTGPVSPCHEWEYPIRDKEYKKKLAIVSILPHNQPELYLPGHNIHPTLPPLNQRWKAHYFGDDNHAGATGAITASQNDDSPREILAAPDSQHNNRSGDRAAASISQCGPSSSSEDLNEGQLRALRKLTAPSGPKLSSHQLAKLDQLPRITGHSKVHVFRNERDPNQKEYGFLDHDGTFHPLPPLPSPEHLQELEERKRNEPRQFTSPIIDRESVRRGNNREYGGGNINREYDIGNKFDGTRSVARYLDFKAHSKYNLSHKASRNQTGFGETIPSLSGNVGNEKRQNRSRATAQRSHSVENRAVQKAPNITSPGKSVKKKPSIFNMKHSLQADEVIEAINTSNVSTDKVKVKKGGALTSLKQSLSFTKLSEKATEPIPTIDAGQGKDDSNFSLLDRSHFQAKLKRPAKESNTVPEIGETCSSGGLKKLFKSFSPSKWSNSGAQIAQSHERSTDDVTAKLISSDKSPARVDQVGDCDNEPSSVLIHEPIGSEILSERSNKPHGKAVEDCGEACQDNNMEKKKVRDIMLSSSTERRMSDQSLQCWRTPNEVLATAHAGTSHADLCLCDDLAAEELKARKLAEVKAMDAECLEGDHYMARALGRGIPVSNAALSSNMTTAKEKAEARDLGESIQKVHEKKEPLVEKGAEHKKFDKVPSNPSSKMTLRARMEKYPS
ncbi:hypothetical protein G7Y79_00023g053790 [Physcia stellaris]|nr:hypothetical protein G7Y79_00023g053790 [Physcia stellaris]